MPPTPWSVHSRIIWFGVAGLIGFVVDAGVLTLLVAAGLDSRIARLFSFACAVAVTWLINRSRAFGDRTGPPSLAEFMRYASASLLAALVNLGVFTVLVTLGGPFPGRPVLTAAVSTGLSMCVNFWSYNRIVFAADRNGLSDEPADPKGPTE